MSKKFKTYCRILNFVEQHDPELAELLKGTCVDLTLNSFRNKAGITFLMPKEPALRKKISDLAYSDNVDDASKAADMLNAMIFRDVYKTGHDWANNKNNLPNSLLPSQHVPYKSSTADTVEFASGAKARVDTRFKDSSKRKNMAVWILESGEIPVTTDKPATFVPFGKRGKDGKGKGGKVGGYDVSDGMASNLRFQIAVAVENIYMADHVKEDDVIFGGCEHKTGEVRDIFLETTMSLVSFIIEKGNTRCLYGKVLPLISFQKIDFYNLLEPHVENPQLIDEGIIRDWWTSRTPVNVAKVIEQVHQLMVNIPTDYRAAKIYSDPIAVITAVNDTRMQILEKTEGSARSIATSIGEVYKELSGSNRIGDLNDIYPSDLSNIYLANPCLKQIQDELRYLTYLMFAKLEGDTIFDRNRYTTIINMIAEVTHTAATDKERALKLTNPTTLKYLIQPSDRINEIKTFVCSTHFLYAPIPEDICKNYPFKDVIRQPAPGDDSAIWNIDRGMLSQHKRLATAGNKDVVELIKKLKSMNINALDQETQAELLAIYKKISG